MATIAEFVHARADDGDRVALRFEDETWTWAEYVDACAARATYLLDTFDRDAPPHIGVLLDNTPEFVIWLGAVALAGHVLVGINPTRRGAELARDIVHTDCQAIVTEGRHRNLLDGLDLGAATARILDVDTEEYAATLAPYRGSGPPHVEVDRKGTYLLLFTSGTSGAPKACILSQGRLASASGKLSEMQHFVDDDVMYQVMPLFH
jgi:fatty-acyl-CoA synthase